jgi:hypothetical protein
MERVNLLAISGKAYSGKDTIGDIIQFLTSTNGVTKYEVWKSLQCVGNGCSNWKIVKFADSLKDIVCILTGCTREQLEDSDFKNSNLPKEWDYIRFLDGELIIPEKRPNLQPSSYTFRSLLQILGTNLLRNQLHENVWVNALFSKYKKDFREYKCSETYPSWIITDVRFPNEARAVKDRGGIVIRVNRNNTEITKMTHISETALDGYDFDWIIDNNGTIEDLIVKTKEMLEYYGII